MSEEAAGLSQSGSKQEFATGSRRDASGGKPMPDLISPFFKMRVGHHLMAGAIWYGKHNWSKGQPNSRYRESLERHLTAADMGMTDEDHLSAAAFNIMGIIHNQEMKKLGVLPPALDDWPINWNDMINGRTPTPDIKLESARAQMEETLKASESYWATLRKKLKQAMGIA